MATVVKIIIVLLAIVGLLAIFFIAWVLTLKEDEPIYKKRRKRYQFTNLTPEQWEKQLNLKMRPIDDIMLDLYSNDDAYISDGYETTFTYSGVKELVENSRKETAIWFAWYVINHPNDFQPSTPNGTYIGVDLKSVSSEELYELFIKSLIK